MSAVPATADLSFWDGRWAPESSPEWCANSFDDPTDAVPIGIRLTGNAPSVEGYESGCSVDKITNIVDTDAVILTLSCFGEGLTWRNRTVLMMNDKSTMTVYESHGSDRRGGQTMKRVRCP